MSEATSSGCGACAVEDCPSRAAERGCEDLEQAGGRLAGAAVLTFLLPLLCALAAAACTPGGEGLRIGAAFLGLIAGTAIASLIQRRRAA